MSGKLESVSSDRLKNYDTEEYESYSRSMPSKQERRSIQREQQEYAIVDKDNRNRASWWRKLLPSIKKITRTKPGVLILLPYGESTWNKNNTFTGWEDPPLTDEGRLLAQRAARVLIAEGLQADMIYTSRLTRSIQAARAVLEEWNAWYVPLFKTYRLNARMYGAVQGLSKEATAMRLGAPVVQAWRNSLKARPPPLDHKHPASPANDRRYGDLQPDQIPVSESLLDCHERARPFWEHRISFDISAGNNVMLVAHRDALRGIIKGIDGLGHQETLDVVLPAGVPLVYRFDKYLNPIPPSGDKQHPARSSAIFLGKARVLTKALARQKDWKHQFDTGPNPARRVSTVEAALEQLRLEEQLSARVLGQKRFSRSKNVKKAQERWADDDFELFDFDDDWVDGGWGAEESDDTQKDDKVSLPIMSSSNDYQHKDDPVIVFVRHGKTPHNNLGLFTGFQDPPLADDGVQEAKRAGRLLKRYGFEFDVVYTSQLTRSIQTAMYILDELGTLWLPMVKSWRLNERMYGALTGKSKKMIENEYGADQLVKWRRGYKIRPPPVSSFSPDYPGNDERRTKHVSDLRISISESIARSFEQRKLVLHRKFPKTESLYDCMQRSIPFYTDRIVTEAVARQKRVLIASHENAIRGILMYLCSIPEDAMQKLHLPNGVPLIYNIKSKCITLLHDDLDDEPATGIAKGPSFKKISVHDFGPAAKYLFRPCELDNAFFDAMEKEGDKQHAENASAARA